MVCQSSEYPPFRVVCFCNEWAGFDYFSIKRHDDLAVSLVFVYRRFDVAVQLDVCFKFRIASNWNGDIKILV